MKTQEYLQRTHNKELRTLAEIMRKIVNGVFWIRSVSFQQELMGSKNYRLTIYLQEKE